ncbi:MAG: hypothetical protein U0136_20605 [Bdellovibrionota bacterium]
MSRIAFVLGVVLLGCLTTVVRPAFADNGTVRGVAWGASAEQIKAAEKSTFKHDATSGAVQYLVYSDTFAGESVSVVYRLIQNRLFELIYNFETKGRKCADMAKKYSEVTQILTKDYGEGQVKSSADPCNATLGWEKGPTSASAVLSTDSGRTDLSVHFVSTELAKIAQQVTTVTTTTSELGSTQPLPDGRSSSEKRVE